MDAKGNALGLLPGLQRDYNVNFYCRQQDRSLSTMSKKETPCHKSPIIRAY